MLSLQTAASCLSSHLPQRQNSYPQVYPEPSSHAGTKGGREGTPHILLHEHPSQKACWIRRPHLDTPHKAQSPMEISKCPSSHLKALASALGEGVPRTHHPCWARSTLGSHTFAGISTAGSQSRWHASLQAPVTRTPYIPILTSEHPQRVLCLPVES